MKSSRMNIEPQSQNKVVVNFLELAIGDVFRVFDEDQLYIMVYMPSGTMVIKQGVHLDNGGRRVFKDHTRCVQVKMVCSWTDM